MIEISDNIKLKCFDKDEDKWFIERITNKNDSESNFIHQVDSRLNLSRKTEKLELSNAYLIQVDDQVVGYCYFSGNRREQIYYEHTLLKEHRGKGLGSVLLDRITDKAMEENPDVRQCILSIDKSNTRSTKAAENAGFFLEEETVFLDKMEFIKDSPYYDYSKRNKSNR